MGEVVIDMLVVVVVEEGEGVGEGGGPLGQVLQVVEAAFDEAPSVFQLGIVLVKEGHGKWL